MHPIVAEDPYAEGVDRHVDTTTSRRQRRYARRRSEILKAAAAVVADSGYHGTSLDLVAERLDMAKATLYYYFPSKDEVILACLATCAQFVTRRLDKIANAEGTASEKLRLLIMEQLTITTRDYPEMSRLFLYPLDWAPELAARVREMQDEHSQRFRAVIEEGRGSGEFVVENLSIALVCMHGAMNQVPRWLSHRQRGVPKHEELERVADTIMRIFNCQEANR